MLSGNAQDVCLLSAKIHRGMHPTRTRRAAPGSNLLKPGLIQSLREVEHRVRRLDLDRLGRHRQRRHGFTGDGYFFHRDPLGKVLLDQPFEVDRIEKLHHLGIELRPEVVRHAGAVVFAVAIFFAAALSGVERFVHGDDDVGNADFFRFARKRIAASGAAHGIHQLMTAQFAEQLLQIRKGNMLALADAGQSYGAEMLTHGHVDHRGYGKTSFGGQSHGGSPQHE